MRTQNDRQSIVLEMTQNAHWISAEKLNLMQGSVSNHEPQELLKTPGLPPHLWPAVSVQCVHGGCGRQQAS